MRIYIPTMGRVGKQSTVRRLPKEVLTKYSATLICPPDEVKQHHASGLAYVSVLPCRAKGIAATRQWILDQSDDPIVLMLDDDLPTWRGRGPEGDVVKYHKATDSEIIKGLAEFAAIMEHYAHGSIGHALFCQNHPPIYYNSRMLRALAYNIPLVQRVSAKFRLKVMEDFDMQLQLMAGGYSNVVYNRLVQDQHQNNSEGGCSGYRTRDVQAAAAHELAKRWPQFVSVVTKSPKRQWIGMGEERTDVRVNWRAAAKTGGCHVD